MSEKISIQDLTAAIDLGARDLWDTLSPEEQKQVTFYTLNRYASSVRSKNRVEQELAVLATNEHVNKHFYTTAKHPKLLWYLIAMTGNDSKKIHFHEWIGFKKKTSTNKVLSALEVFYPHLKDDELELLSAMTTNEDIKEYARDSGMSEDEIKKII